MLMKSHFWLSVIYTCSDITEHMVKRLRNSVFVWCARETLKIIWRKVSFHAKVDRCKHNIFASSIAFGGITTLKRLRCGIQQCKLFWIFGPCSALYLFAWNENYRRKCYYKFYISFRSTLCTNIDFSSVTLSNVLSFMV